MPIPHLLQVPKTLLGQQIHSMQQFSNVPTLVIAQKLWNDPFHIYQFSVTSNSI